MKIIATITTLAVLALAAAAPAAVSTRHLEGTVVSVNRDAKTFRLHDAERGTVRIKVTSRTRFERVTFASLKAGAKRIEATVKRVDGAWVATSVERSGGGGDHGGGGNDDGAGHDAGDDHGGNDG
jgi:uncharacterized protein (DUF58 family)